MANFLKGNDLNAAMENILRNATNELILISPFIKLHDRYRSSLLTHKENDTLSIVVVFGKNEDNIARSMSVDDIYFFMQFPNIEIRYEKRLHAKYFANESSAILTSMNLYSFSQDNNIEVGVLVEKTLLGNNLDKDAFYYFDEVINQAELIFKKSPQYENTLMGLRKKYTQSTIEIDKLSTFFTAMPGNKSSVSNSEIHPKKPLGYCIRTGVQIPFNKDKPLSHEAYKLWNKNPNNSENYCHFSGEKSNGETSVAKPILSKNWKKAKEIFGL